MSTEQHTCGREQSAVLHAGAGGDVHVEGEARDGGVKMAVECDIILNGGDGEGEHHAEGEGDDDARSIPLAADRDGKRTPAMANGPPRWTPGRASH